VKQQLELEGSLREERGKNASRRLRVAGRVPAVLYGENQDAVAITLDRKEMTRILAQPSGHNRILSLKLDGGKTESAMAIDWQVDPLRNTLLHVDVKRVDLSKPVLVTVPVKTVGVAVGVKEQGGFEEVVTREVQIECMPLDVPEKIELDITNLGVGQAIRAGDLAANEQWKVRTDPRRVLVHVVVKKEVVEVAAETPVAAATPEAGADAAKAGAKPEEVKKEGGKKDSK
jgi:large subunit ribosomal protein L25